MATAGERWWVITGAAAALHGVEGPVADVDVLLGRADAHALFPALGLPPVAGMQSARYRSDLFGRWLDLPLPVEFMAGFRLDGAEVRPVTREAIAVDGHILFVPARTELAVMLRALGRPKNLARAARLTP